MFNRKLKGFTLMELMVVMVLSGISITLVYGAYQFIQRSYLNFSDQNQRIEKIAQVKQIMTQDNESCQWVLQADSGLVFQSNGTAIVYQFNENQLIRIHPKTIDTLIVSQPNFTITHYPEHELVQQFELTINLDEERINLNFTKEYSAEDVFSFRRAQQTSLSSQ